MTTEHLSAEIPTIRLWSHLLLFRLHLPLSKPILNSQSQQHFTTQFTAKKKKAHISFNDMTDGRL